MIREGEALDRRLKRGTLWRLTICISLIYLLGASSCLFNKNVIFVSSKGLSLVVFINFLFQRRLLEHFLDEKVFSLSDVLLSASSTSNPMYEEKNLFA